MANFIILAAMKGRFISDQGNTYDNFQMLGYAEASNSKEAVSVFFEQAPYPINWADVEYMWAEELAESTDTAVITESTIGCTLSPCAAAGNRLLGIKVSFPCLTSSIKPAIPTGIKDISSQTPPLRPTPISFRSCFN